VDNSWNITYEKLQGKFPKRRYKATVQLTVLCRSVAGTPRQGCLETIAGDASRLDIVVERVWKWELGMDCSRGSNRVLYSSQLIISLKGNVILCQKIKLQYCTLVLLLPCPKIVSACQMNVDVMTSRVVW
jgi:hypothetical protein